MYYSHHYKIDFNKIKTVEDVVKILKLLDIQIGFENPNIEEMKDYLILEKNNHGTVD